MPDEQPLPLEEGPPPAPATPKTDLDAIVADVVQAVPAVEPAPAATGPAIEARWAALRDRNGNPFDPAIHQTHPDGTPRLTPRGLLWGRGGMALPRQDAPDAGQAPRRARALDLSAAGGKVVDPDDLEDEDEDDLDEDGDEPETEAPGLEQGTRPPAQLSLEERQRLAKDTAEVAVQLLQAMGKFVAGKEGAFKRDEEAGDEYRDLKNSYQAWFETMENLVHISPGWIVAVNTGRYLSRCASTETGERRIQKGMSWATSAWSKARLMWHTWRATSAVKH